MGPKAVFQKISEKKCFAKAEAVILKTHEYSWQMEEEKSGQDTCSEHDLGQAC
jgi:hypothetical protein